MTSKPLYVQQPLADKPHLLGMLDTYTATKDYLRAGRCVRFIAVLPSDLSKVQSRGGVPTITVDIDYWQFCQQLFRLAHWRDVRSHVRDRLDAQEELPEVRRAWYVIEYNPSVQGANYFYNTFDEEAEPKFFDLGPITQFRGPQPPLVANIHQPPQPPVLMPPKPYVFDAFHVGQGMCSLVHNGHYGVLIDAGAGKPVTRSRYRAGNVKSDLTATVLGLKALDMVVSHADSDHWRLVAWDQLLRTKIRRIYVPLRTRALALRDPAVIAKVSAVGDMTILLDGVSRLDVYRSKPDKSDSNGECLVAIFRKAGSQVLAAGDYVYERMLIDHKSTISALQSGAYAGIVVPHHGDHASAHKVFAASPTAKAFFSAGTHQGYNHPSVASIMAHQKQSFQVIHNRRQRHIKRVNLI